MAQKKATTKSKTKTQKAAAKTAPAATAAATAKPKVKPAGQLPSLRTWNIWLAVVFALQAVALVLYTGSKSYPLTMQYLAPDALATEANGHQVLAAATRHLLDVHIAWLLAVTLIVLAVANLAVATVFRKHYERFLALGSNAPRWVGLGIGSGLLMSAIALASGISQLSTLLLIFVSMALGCGLVPLAEKLHQEGKGLTQHAVCAAATVATALPLVVLALGALGALLWNGKIPAQLYAVYASGLVLYVAWGLAGHFRVYRQGRWADTLFAERAFLLLGFATVTALTWQLIVIAT
jgi:hypothetical protein